MKYFKSFSFVLLTSVISANATAWQQREDLPLEACKIHIPWGIPENKTGELKLLCREGYFVGYDESARLPKYTAYVLTENHTVGCNERTNAFKSDDSVKNKIKPSNYYGLGMDKGHMTPDSDTSWDVQVQRESLLMTNISPQHPSFNRGIWAKLEYQIRLKVFNSKEPHIIYTGSVYNTPNVAGRNSVIVPTQYYKIIVNVITGETAGWIFPHEPPYEYDSSQLVRYRKPISFIEKEANIKFNYGPLSKELQLGKSLEHYETEFTAIKRAKCGREN